MQFIDKAAVTISDINYGNHLDHTRFIAILHETRLRFLKSIKLAEQLDSKTILVVRNLSVRYRHTVDWGDLLTISLDVCPNHPFLPFAYKVFNETKENISGTATITMVPVNVETARVAKHHPIYDLLK